MKLLHVRLTRAAISVLVCLAAMTVSAGAERPLRRPAKRAARPTRWEPVVRNTFEANAFSRLEGKMPESMDQPADIRDDRRQPAPVVAGEFDRSAMMRELRLASASIEEMLASEQALARPTPQGKDAVDVVLALGGRLANDDPDYSADVNYVRHAEEMTNAARRLKRLLATEKHGEALEALRAFRSSCQACHDQFNP